MSCTLKFNMNALFIIPILNGLNGVVGMWSVYVLAQQYNPRNGTEPFPYISECGDKPPASCWFSQVCNNGCILALIFEVLHFKNNQLLHGDKKTLNIISFFLGIISSVGLSITGNFQVSSVKVVHYIGAGLAFFVGLLYLWIQLCLIRKWILKIVGFCLCIICSILFGLMLWFRFKDSPSKAAIFEWSLTTFFFLIYPLFVADFSKMEYSLTANFKTSQQQKQK